MEFKKLNLEVFSKAELSFNKLRSITGGYTGTCDDTKDSVDSDGCTYFYGDDYYDCDTNKCI